MKNILFLLLLAMNLPLGAAPVDSLEARVIAQQYFKSLHPEKSQVAIHEAVATLYRGTVTRYTFVFENNDFVVVAGDNAAVPILAYSRQQSYETEDFSPDLTWWMETEYDQWIYSLQAQKAGNQETLPLWEQIKEGHYEIKSGNGVPPLVTSRWGQSRTNDYQCPGYNDKVPVPRLGCNCTRCTAGCVAVSMAQIMNYWRFPERNEGRVFDWCHMPDKLIKMEGLLERPEFAVECNAIAGLLVNCGARAQLNYCSSHCATASTIGQAGDAIQGAYGYNTEMQHRYRTVTAGWTNKLRESLDGGMPVLYGGQSGSGGHAFVCDGYESVEYFHFNWGWTGAYDGYFYITATAGSPEFDYDGLQEALFYIHPGSWNRPDCPKCGDTLDISNSLSATPYNAFFPNIVWDGLPFFYNYSEMINPFIPVNATIVNGNGVPRLQYDDISAGVVRADQVEIPDHVNVQIKAFLEIELSNFETAWGAEFTAEIMACPDGKKWPGEDAVPLADDARADASSQAADPAGFSLFPNPATGCFTIECRCESGENITIALRDLSGSGFFRACSPGSEKGLYRTEIITSGLAPGLYFVELRNGCGVWTKKVVVE